MNKQVAEELNDRFSKAEAHEVLQFFIGKYHGKYVFSTSLGAEDQVLTHMISKLDNSARIFTLDTGRLFQETYELLDRTNKHFGIEIEIFFPDRTEVQEMINRKGINLFYESIENRKLCCYTRKTSSLKKALKDTDIWITGIRREQAITRYGTGMVEWDENFSLIKVNPLRDWTESMIWKYIHANNLPYNELHDRGYPSIGCAPCTRAINPGEDIRAGRWWWELPENKECGIHDKKDSN